LTEVTAKAGSFGGASLGAGSSWPKAPRQMAKAMHDEVIKLALIMFVSMSHRRPMDPPAAQVQFKGNATKRRQTMRRRSRIGSGLRFIPHVNF
jgi:hypothetical protein